MTVFQVNNLSVRFHGTSVFSGASAVLGAGSRAGVVGPNGAGKTTLLRAILGQLQPDEGSVDWIRAPRIGYVPQKWEPGDRLTPLDAVGYEHVDMLGQCGIGRALWGRPCASLSGGERTRLLLARALSQNPEVLVLDEPTNHLDIPGIEWLEKEVRGFRGSVLAVSHDRFFLDEVATEIWEVRENRLMTYPGNYSAYELRLEELRATEAREYAKWQRRVRELAGEVRERRQWYEKAHDDAGINDFYRRKAKKHARQFKAKERMLEKALAGEPELRRGDRSLSVGVGHAGHRTRTILRASGLRFSYAGRSEAGGAGRTILDGANLSLGPKDKVGLIGPNGSGKTTLIRLLLGELEPVSGTIWVNPAVRVGYLSQLLAELDPDASTADNVKERTGLTLAEARNLLGRMGITGDTQVQPLGTLSMGERTRVAVSCLCFGRFDALVLDEPTNHLDASARDCVEGALSSFPGSLVVATHDRYFLDRVCDAVWSLEGGRIRTVNGNYTAYRAEKEREDLIASGTHTAGSEDAMRELALQAEIAFLVSRIAAARDVAEKEDLERRYRVALGDLKALRSARSGDEAGRSSP